MKHIRQNWAYPYAVCSYLAVWLLASASCVAQTWRFGSTVLGSIWILTLIASFLLCYRPSTIGQILLRCITLGGSGLWIMQTTLPGFSAGFLARSGWLRILGICFAVLCEGAAMLAMLRILTGRQSDMEYLRNRGVPPLMIAIMSAEARFWRWVWCKLSGR